MTALGNGRGVRACVPIQACFEPFLVWGQEGRSIQSKLSRQLDPQKNFYTPAMTAALQVLIYLCNLEKETILTNRSAPRGRQDPLPWAVSLYSGTQSSTKMDMAPGPRC